jgi:hypothetical protein
LPVSLEKAMQEQSVKLASTAIATHDYKKKSQLD